MGLIETWKEEKEWRKWKKECLRIWCGSAKDKDEKGRSNRDILNRGEKGNKRRERIMERRIKTKEETWRTVTVYNRSMKKTGKLMDEKLNENDEEKQ